MTRRMRVACWVAVLAWLGTATPVRADELKPLEFVVTFDKAVSDKPFTGRVYVILSKREIQSPPSSLNWFRPDPTLARDVKDWKPGEKLVLGKESLSIPATLDKLSPETYSAIAVMDFDRGHLSFSAAEGNGYSKPIRKALDPARTGPIELTIDQVVKPREFKETDRVKLCEMESKLLTKFHGRPVTMRAGVVLPESFKDNPKRQYPVVYEIPGFSGTHTGAFFAAARKATDVGGVDMLWVMLDPSCRLGHHVFADSANNGPWGQALVEEFIPHIEKQFRGIGQARARFVTGHSSGGWSSLWLQTAYPDTFGGCWSTAPDPVDFRDFQRVNLYAKDANLFTDDKGQSRPLARRNKEPVLFFKPFSEMEDLMRHGGQLQSFEAVFSPRGEDGWPRKLWDRKTGAIDAAVAKTWEQYDVRLVLERNWKTLGPKLAGKIHVYTGEEDTFYLEGAVRLLKDSLKGLGSDAKVELFPGKDHSTLMDRKLRERIGREMAEQFRRLEARAD